jgi:hypothetical protein
MMSDSKLAWRLRGTATAVFYQLRTLGIARLDP